MSNASDGPRVAIIGAGASGFYLAKSLLDGHETLRVDLIEQLPAPYGLVRYGVAPDHARVKGVTRVFDRVLAHPRVRYFGNVRVGTHISTEVLHAIYDAVAYTVGASSSRALRIPGEGLPGHIAASEFVAWYNGHPNAAGLSPRLGGPTAAVIGLGNVALDVTRMLMCDPAGLDTTDMAPYAVRALEAAKVRTVHIIGRRGPSQAGFTPKELKEVADLPGVDVVTDPAHLKVDRVAPAASASDRARAEKNGVLFREAAQRWSQPPTPGAKRVELHFFRSPVEVLGDGLVQGVRMEHNGLTDVRGRLRPHPTGTQSALKVDLLLRSVGYRSDPIHGVPFHAARGIILNEGGRVVDHTDQVLPGIYASGWVRRGPTGVIGVNRKDAAEVAVHILADLPGLPAGDGAAELPQAFADAGVRVVNADDWAALAAEEARRGQEQGRVAIKFVSTADALAFLDGAGRAPPAAQAS